MITEIYLASAATCTQKARYYYSCDCGEKGSSTFDYGNILEHNYGEWVSNGNGTHTKTCADDNKHTITENCNGGTATCNEKATCQDCNTQYGTLGDHTYETEWSHNETHHWKVATCGCDLKQNYGEHTPDASGWCTVCDQSIKATEGVIYEVSSDGTYAEVVDYIGTSNRVRIADTFKSLPVKNIYDKAFSSYSINCVIIPDGITRIGKSAFQNCLSLSSITIPNTITEIDDSAFYSCKLIQNVVLSNNLTSIGNNVFTYCGLIDVTIPDSVLSIGDFAFYGCSKLKRITIGKNVTTIGSYAFTSCDSLVNITLPDSLTSIGNSAFQYCKKLESIVIPNKITDISEWTFYACSALKNVTIGNSVTYLASNSFGHCTSLNKVEIPDTINFISGNAFYNCYQIQYNTYNNVYYLGNSNNPCVVAVKTVTNKLSEYFLHENTKLIASSAFSNCQRLTTIKIPEKVTAICEKAFEKCSQLSSITIPNNITHVAYDAFNNCNIENATIPTTAISYIKSNNLKSVIITSGTSIAKSAFNGCNNLTHITISKSVNSIENLAFAYCKNLKNIYYLGNFTEWDKINISTNGNSYLTSAARYYYSETKPTESGNFWHYDDNGNIAVW